MLKNIIMNFEINQELKKLIPPLTREEFTQLETNIIKDGVRDALVLGEYLDKDELITVLIDGHNRLEIAMESDMPYKTTTIKFKSYFDIKEWMITHQFGRRNLNNYQRCILALQLESVYSEKAKKNLSLSGGDKKSESYESGLVISPKAITPIDTRKSLSKIANVGEQTIARVKKLEEKATPELKEKLEKSEVSINQAYQEVRKVEKKENLLIKIEEIKQKIEDGIDAPTGLFEVIAIDPPWDYSERGGSSSKQFDDDGNRGGVNYPTMTIEQLKKLSLPSENDCVLFLWTTHAFIRDSYDLLEAWGFKYKAIITWDKEKMGMGRNIRMQCEFCLLATKGSPILIGGGERDIIRESRREHSRKPEEFYNKVERMTFGRKLDYFSREPRKNWFCYGAENEKF